MQIRRTAILILAITFLALPALPAVGSDCNISISLTSPFNGIVDARQPYEPDDAENPQGTTTIQFWMSSSAASAEEEDFHIMASNGEVLAIDSFDISGQIVTIGLEEPIPAGTVIALTHCSRTSSCFGYLPGDVDGNGTSNAADVVYHVDCLNEVEDCELWQCDIDRDNDCD